MCKVITLKITDGDFEQGFPVFLRIEKDSESKPIEIYGKLPPAPKIPDLYAEWRLSYSRRGTLFRKLKKIEASARSYSVKNAAIDLKKNINSWLNSGDSEFRPVRDGLLRNLNGREEETRFIIQAQDVRLWKIPWYLWDVIEASPDVEVALSFPHYEKLQLQQTSDPSVPEKVRILAILGNSEGIDTRKDRILLEEMPFAETTFLVEPDRQKINDSLWENSWDILFFAGHSNTEGETGKIDINRQDSLTIEELRYAVKKAIANGLKIAIFNSCDGLGLARQLADLKLPHTIVMREPVPDLIAQEFLKHFLEAFRRGKSFYVSVREARERLQGLEGEYPCATWLPVICDNPAELAPTWNQLYHQKEERLSKLRQFWRSGRSLLQTSVLATGLVVGVRLLGMMEGFELGAFDHLMRRRPHETRDERLLLITATPDDIEQEQNKRQPKHQASLSDPTITKIFQKLEQYEPKTIGWDIYRDFPVDPDHPELKKHFNQENLFTICKVIDPNLGKVSGISPPPEIPKNGIVGFNDAIADKDGILRRFILSLKPQVPTDPCTATNNLSLLLALHYLHEKHDGVEYDSTPAGDLKITVPKLEKTVVLKQLKPHHTGGYQRLDTKGRQILLNYRSRPSPSDIAREISVGDLLADRVPANTIEELKNRIVLIGIAAPVVTSPDSWRTPYSAIQSINDNEMPGVYIQAHMVSDILSAILDDRPLLWVLPVWNEAFWIFIWALVGGLIAHKMRSPLQLVIATGIALGALYGACYLLILQGGWVPLIPSGIALIVTDGAIAILSHYKPKNKEV